MRTTYDVLELEPHVLGLGLARLIPMSFALALRSVASSPPLLAALLRKFVICVTEVFYCELYSGMESSRTP